MGKRYFCDYCDRSFQDNLHNRKKHLNGVQHLRAKKGWFDRFRGQCDFGSNCRFSHLTERDLERLSAQVHEERRSREQQLQQLDGTDGPEAGIEEWLERRALRLNAAQSSGALSAKSSVFQYPPGWPPIQDLPPSLRAPPPGGWALQSSAQWG
ncbi:zinc finger matrin-type protein 5 isoform X2 [Tachyglossus aculeatus]|uniref:zinc finger matrin-type protein 5 isoform X2 n=1 Tax=Tachyglossus aculeatus TaxID=9261 RepID=UPI0018F54ABD|nr:zinc finger matrin-type protein 5 isoform X2 [Tachyglossus aculeatus]